MNIDTINDKLDRKGDPLIVTGASIADAEACVGKDEDGGPIFETVPHLFLDFTLAHNLVYGQTLKGTSIGKFKIGTFPKSICGATIQSLYGRWMTQAEIVEALEGDNLQKLIGKQCIGRTFCDKFAEGRSEMIVSRVFPYIRYELLEHNPDAPEVVDDERRFFKVEGIYESYSYLGKNKLRWKNPNQKELPF